MSRDIFIVAAHPDDEVLGCGGTAALHVAQGDRVIAVIVCEGESTRYGTDGFDHQPLHAEAAAAIIGFDDLVMLGLPDQQLDVIPLRKIIGQIEAQFSTYSPAVVYTHWRHDLNRDHQIVYEATMVASRPVRDSIEVVRSFDTPSTTEWGLERFLPDTYVDISAFIDVKLRALAEYKREMRPPPHPRSLHGVEVKSASYGSEVCVNYAEAFATVRQVFRGPNARP